MTRGNQREKAREKNQAAANKAKNKNSQSGTEFARTKEAQAAIMREKQAKGRLLACSGGFVRDILTPVRSCSKERRSGSEEMTPKACVPT